MEEVATHYPSNRELIFSLWFIKKNDTGQSFIKVDSHDKSQVMLSMGTGDVHDEESDYSLSDESYHSHYSTDQEVEEENSAMVIYQYKHRTLKVNSRFDNVIEFRRALAHYAIINEFAYYIEKSEPTRVTARCLDIECKWRIHASVMQDEISFEVKSMLEPHSCTRSKKGANKVATQGWIASVVRDKLKSDGDVKTIDLQKWVKKIYNVDVPYMKVFRGKEQAYSDMYGNWEDSLMKTNDFKEELLRRNPGSIVEVDFDRKEFG
ncbi:hypothetical protein L1987_87950 [Smallanthus sonchifolius]|nr:hypothetical protein L1987_87950 [Smallanthus sonchifolius]